MNRLIRFGNAFRCSRMIIRMNSTASDSQHTSQSFNALQISPKTLRALTDDFKYQTMSTVQQKVLTLLPMQNDLLVRAKTGTGKTLAFLIAALESCVMDSSGKVPVLVLSPTRELALQIAREAARLVRHHRWVVKTAVGGTSRSSNINDLLRSRCDILVATPGRINDLLQSEPQIQKRFEKLQVLVFDEADVLLAMGFRDELEAIADRLPPACSRQNFMFSATLGSEIRAIAASILKPGFAQIDTVPANEQDTHQRISQSYAVIPAASSIATLRAIIKDHQLATPKAKIIVFFSTTKMTAYMSEVFLNFGDMNVMQIHSKLSQTQRMRISDRFRASYSSVLFTSDVSARGVDYPGVTLVVQYGIPSNREQYIHRIGRTGRAGREGQGILMVSPFEQHFINHLTGIPIRKDVKYSNPVSHETDLIRKSVEAVHVNDRMDVYFSLLGFYTSCLAYMPRGNTRGMLYEGVNDVCRGVLGINETPSLPLKLAVNLGLDRVAGVKIRDHEGSIGAFPRRETGWQQKPSYSTGNHSNHNHFIRFNRPNGNVAPKRYSGFVEMKKK